MSKELREQHDKHHDKYVAAWRKRLADEERSRQQRLARARDDARTMARVLGEEFNSRRVWLFGSVATGDTFWTGSEIDLAVEGVDPSRWMEIERRPETVTGFVFDVAAPLQPTLFHTNRLLRRFKPFPSQFRILGQVL